MSALVRSDDVARIGAFLRRADGLFVPPLSQRVVISEYARKLALCAVNLFAVDGAVDQGHAAIYVNDAHGGTAFLSSICALPEYRRQGIAAALLEACLEQARLHAMCEVRLEVGRGNDRAVAFYRRHGFESVPAQAAESSSSGSLAMRLGLVPAAAGAGGST